MKLFKTKTNKMITRVPYMAQTFYKITGKQFAFNFQLDLVSVSKIPVKSC